MRDPYFLLRLWPHEKRADLFAEVRDNSERLCYYSIKNDNNTLEIECSVMTVDNRKVTFEMR